MMFRSFGRQLGTKAMSTNTAYILYDIPGTATKHRSWSPNVWKTRFVTHHPEVRIDAYLELTHAKESFSTTKRYPIGRNGSSSPTSRKWLNVLVRRTPCSEAASRYTQSPSFATLLRTGAFPGRFRSLSI